MVKEKGWFDDHSDDEKIEVTIFFIAKMLEKTQLAQGCIFSTFAFLSFAFRSFRGLREASGIHHEKPRAPVI